MQAGFQEGRRRSSAQPTPGIFRCPHAVRLPLFLRKSDINPLKFFPQWPIERIACEAFQRCDLTRPNATLSPWRQVRRPLRPDEHPCRQGTLLTTRLFILANSLIDQRGCLQKSAILVFQASQQTHAHRHPISGYSDHRRAARTRRAMGFPARSRGGLRMPPGSLHVCRPSPRSGTHSQLLHGQGQPVRIGVSRQLPEFAAQHFDLCAHRTPLVESARALEFWSQHLRPESVAIPRADS